MKAILEIKGTLAGVTSEHLLKMTSAEVLAIYAEIEKSLDAANTTEPAPPKSEVR
jgi:hypothetical protein